MIPIMVNTGRVCLYLKDWVDELLLLGLLAGTMLISGIVRVLAVKPPTSCL